MTSPTFNRQVQPGLAAYLDTAVPDFGYRWWYLDVVSDDHETCLVVIGFIGSVFSPYYASARRRGHGDPYAHCALNAILYTPRRKFWAMTERSAAALSTTRQRVGIGSSALYWQDGKLQVSVDEWTNPIPGRMRGHITLDPGVISTDSWALHENDRHWWWPVAPLARAEVRFEHPSLQFSGSAYLDSNFGSEPLEQGFHYWDWTRSAATKAASNDAALTYFIEQRDGQRRALSLRSNTDGRLEPAVLPGRQPLPPSGWRVAREICCNANIRRVQTLEDTPFYVRSLVETDDAAHPRLVHESLSLRRFGKRWVQTLLPFRMPRRNRAPR